MTKDRYPANCWLPYVEILGEIDRLKFAVAALAEIVADKGSFERENAQNVARGIKSRLDYLHDSIRHRQEDGK
jgi:hypothetical protein